MRLVAKPRRTRDLSWRDFAAQIKQIEGGRVSGWSYFVRLRPAQLELTDSTTKRPRITGWSVMAIPAHGGVEAFVGSDTPSAAVRSYREVLGEIYRCIDAYENGILRSRAVAAKRNELIDAARRFIADPAGLSFEDQALMEATHRDKKQPGALSEVFRKIATVPTTKGNV